MMELKAPFPYFGGKRTIAGVVWQRLGSPRQYIEPFCGSAAMLLAAPSPASLEVVNDANGFIANFWRAVKCQPDKVAEWADYPVSHIDLGARHKWLMDARPILAESLHDCNWPGDAKVAGWWLWGQCCWIGSGWCDWDKQGKTPHASDAGMGIQAIGQVPHASNAGMGIQAIGQVPHASDAGRGIITSAGRTAWRWLHELADRLERVRVVHGHWDRCLNNHFGGAATAVFLDPPYLVHLRMFMAQAIPSPVKWKHGRETTQLSESRSADMLATMTCQNGKRSNGHAVGTHTAATKQSILNAFGSHRLA